MTDCIGCGYCCRKAPCYVAREAIEAECKVDTADMNFSVIWDENKGCPGLEWDDDRWVCSLFVNAEGDVKDVLMHGLAIGEGCCSNLNTYRRYKHVPTPNELEDEQGLLRRLQERKKG